MRVEESLTLMIGALMFEADLMSEKVKLLPVNMVFCKVKIDCTEELCSISLISELSIVKSEFFDAKSGPLKL